MPRWSQRTRRGGGGGTEAPGPTPPEQPEPPSFSSAVETEPGVWQVDINSPTDYPTGSTEWDLYAEVGADPPTVLALADMPTSGTSTYPGIGTGSTLFAFLRAWNADHDAYTDSTTASFTP